MRILLIAFLAFFAAGLEAQTPGTRMTVDVRVDSVVLRGDTTRVTYVLSNQAQSQDSLVAFIVDAPARVSYIPRPQPDSVWMVDSVIHGNEPAAFWANLDLIPPSTSTVPILFESVGLPGIVTSTVQGKTVGVDVWPVDRSAQALLARLRTLTQSSCASPLLWITDAALCGQLLSDVDAAEAYRASGASTQAQSTLDHYKTLLAGPDPGTFAPGVTSPAFWLLKSNADIVKGTL
jgi:hypothetical protein